MRDIPSALQTHIAADVTSLTKCFEVIRTDNKVVRLTTHDRDLTIDGNTYRTLPGVEVSALESSDDLSVDNAELTLGIDGTILIADDFRFGEYDRASVSYFLVNWEDVTDGKIFLKRGDFGDITLNDDDNTATIQIRGLTHALQRAIVERYSPTCRVNLGGAKCGVVNVPTRVRRNRQRVKTWDWYLVPAANVTNYVGTNWGFESDGNVANGIAGITGWLYGTGSYWKVRNDFTAGAGTHYLEGGNDGLGSSTGAEMLLYQTITTTTIGMVNGDIDAGGLSLDLQALIAATSDTVSNPGRVSIEQLDVSGNTLSLQYSDYITPIYQEWQGTGLTVFMLPGARSVKIGLYARKDDGVAATVAFDDVKLRFWTNEVSTWDGAVFRTMRIPSRGNAESMNLANPSFEFGGAHANATSGIPGWDYAVGAYFQTVTVSGPMSPHLGAYMLKGGDNGTTNPDQVYKLSQTIAIIGSPAALNITDGWYFAEASIWYAKLDAASDPRFTLDFLDADDVVLSTLDTGYDTGGTTNAWRQFKLGARIPTTATQIKYTIWARSGAASAANVIFDEATAFVMVTAYQSEDDEEYGLLDTTVPSYDYTVPEYSIDGDALVQAQPYVFAYGVVETVVDNRTFTDSSISMTASLFYSGKVVWLSGNNAGKTSFVRVWDDTGKQARLYSELRYDIQVGDLYVYAPGCDKSIARCADTFGNAMNFRGEPYLPGPGKVIEFLTVDGA